MGNALQMQIVYTLDQLLEDALGFPLFNSPELSQFQIAVQALALDMLHDQVDCLVGVNGFIELNNVGVLKSLEERYFSRNRAFLFRVVQSVLVIDLHGYLIIGHLIPALPDNCISTLS